MTSSLVGSEMCIRDSQRVGVVGMRPGGANRAAVSGVPGTTTVTPERPAAVSASWGVPGSGSPLGSWMM
eukprot:11939596-Prorocentrum_lima.AAC.1